jgi:tetratricopeptide (TPR) repeat protein
MARLVVLRGDTVERELELSDAPVKIGRGQKNDVVLEDPMKGISRDHAELRCVDGRYVLVDRESENGIWVAGRRESKVVLDPATVATIGPFRLKVIGQDVPAAGVTPVPNAASLPKAAPAPKTAPVLRTEALPTRPRTAAPTAAKAAGPAPTAQKYSRWRLIGSAAAVVVFGLIAAVWLLGRPEPPVARPEPIDIAAVVARADRAVAEERCQDAIDALGAALSELPDNTDLAGARERAERCRLFALLGEPTPDIPAELQKSAELIAAKQCRDANLRIMNVLSYQPDSAEATNLKQQVERCLAPTTAPPPPPPPTGAKLAVAIPPEQGGLPLHPNELERDYVERVRLMRVRYDEAVAASGKDPGPRVIATFEGLLKSTSSNYLDVAARLAEARRAAAAAAQRLTQEARKAEASEAYDDAIDKLRQARMLDPSMSIDGDVERIGKAKIERGERACREAKVQLNYRYNEAVRNYQLAATLLPSDHECYPVAKKYASASVK